MKATQKWVYFLTDNQLIRYLEMRLLLDRLYIMNFLGYGSLRTFLQINSKLDKLKSQN